MDRTIEPSSPRKSFIIPILVILLVAMTALASYFYYNLSLLKQIGNPLPSDIGLMPEPIPSPTIDPTAGWQTYNDAKNGFSLEVPSDWKINKDEYRTTFGDNISIRVSTVDPEDCRGDCPIINSSTSTLVNGIEARKLEGWWGEVGGNTAQSYIDYVIPTEKNDFVVITVQELPFSYSEIGHQYKPIAEDIVAKLDQILSTFEFTN